MNLIHSQNYTKDLIKCFQVVQGATVTVKTCKNLCLSSRCLNLYRKAAGTHTCRQTHTPLRVLFVNAVSMLKKGKTFLYDSSKSNDCFYFILFVF